MAGTLLATKVDDPLDKIMHTTVMVPKTGVLVAGANEFRRWLYLLNDGNTDMYISFGVPPRLKFGIKIPKGSHYEFSLCDTNLCCDAVYAIQGANTPQILLVTEGA